MTRKIKNSLTRPSLYVLLRTWLEPILGLIVVLTAVKILKTATGFDTLVCAFTLTSFLLSGLASYLWLSSHEKTIYAFRRLVEASLCLSCVMLAITSLDYISIFSFVFIAIVAEALIALWIAMEKPDARGQLL